MRVTYDDLDYFEDLGFRGSPRLKRMLEEQRHRVQRAKMRRTSGPGDDWDDDWDSDDDYDDYDDYDEEEFDNYSVTRR